MQLMVAPLTHVAIEAPATFTVDSQLVQGLRLPIVAGLPDASTHTWATSWRVGPPQTGSAAAQLDLATVQFAQTLRTPAGDAWAQHLATDGPVRVWLDLARRDHAKTGLVQGWLGVALLASTLAANGVVTALAKHHFGRLRPFQIDPSIHPAVAEPRDSSYPSGHASSAFAAARVISVIRPDLAAEAYNLATQVAVSRVYAGVHFPSDVVAGAQLGTQVAEFALHQAGRATYALAAGISPELARRVGLTSADLVGTGLDVG